MKKLTAFDLEVLAVQFRTNDPNLGHVSVFDLMTEAGLAYYYGLFRAIPKHHNRKRRAMAETIATELERKATAIYAKQLEFKPS